MDHVTVTLNHKKIYARDCEECETKDGMLDQIERVITIDGKLDAEQRAKLMEIADKCPVHRTLTSEIRIVTRRLSTRELSTSLRGALATKQSVFVAAF